MTASNKSENRAFDILEMLLVHIMLFGGVLIVLLSLLFMIFPPPLVREHLDLRIIGMILTMATGVGMTWVSLRMRPSIVRRFKSE